MGKTFTDESTKSPKELERVIASFQTAVLDACHVSAGIAIGTTKAKVKTAAAIKLLIDGALVTKAATDDAFVLSGTVAADAFNVYVLTMNAAGTCTAHMGTAGASLAAIAWPTIPDGQVVVGYVIVNPTGTGDFVGGTTDLDDATVVPNAVYVNTPFPFNPNALSIPFAN